MIDPFRGGQETDHQTLGEKGPRRDPGAVGDAGPAGRRGPRGRAGTTHLKHPSGEGPGGSDARSQTEGLSQGSYLQGSREKAWRGLWRDPPAGTAVVGDGMQVGGRKPGSVGTMTDMGVSGR